MCKRKSYMKKSLSIFTLCFLASSAFANNTEKNMHEIISSVMNHDMKEVVVRHKKDLGISDSEAQLHEREMKRFLVLCILHPESGLGMFSSKVDNMWHNFILFTKDYAQFCQKNAGEFMHHAPTIGEQDRTETKLKLRDFVSKYQETFGEKPLSEVWGDSTDENSASEMTAQCTLACRNRPCGLDS